MVWTPKAFSPRRNVIPREGVERLNITTTEHDALLSDLVIPREGVESQKLLPIPECFISLVIPREGVERKLTEFNFGRQRVVIVIPREGVESRSRRRWPGSCSAGDPERGS